MRPPSWFILPQTRDVKVYRDAHQDVRSRPTRIASNAAERFVSRRGGSEFDVCCSSLLPTSSLTTLIRLEPLRLHKDNHTHREQSRTSRVHACLVVSLPSPIQSNHVTRGFVGDNTQVHKAGKCATRPSTGVCQDATSYLFIKVYTTTFQDSMSTRAMNHATRSTPYLLLSGCPLFSVGLSNYRYYSSNSLVFRKRLCQRTCMHLVVQRVLRICIAGE